MGPSEIEALSTAVRVAGPSITWIRDTRDSPLDSHRGTYTSFQDFLSDQAFGAQAEFNRLDLSNSSYYGFDKGRFVLARNTRYGQERAYGPPSARLIPLAGALVCRRSHVASRIPDQRGGATRSGDGISDWRRGRAGKQHRTAAASATASVLRRHLELCAFSRHGQRVYECRGRLGKRTAHSAAGSRCMQGAHRRLLPSHRRCLPFHRARRDQSPPLASRDNAVSTTSHMRRDWACATIRRLDRSGWISAIT